MADDAKAEDGEEIEVGKSGGMMATVLVSVVVALIAGVAGSYLGDRFLTEADPAASDPAAQGSDASSSDAEVEVDQTVSDLGSFTVNLRDSSGRVLSMKVQITIDKDEKNEAKVESDLAEMRDSILMLASDYSYTELEGIDGKMRLKEEIHVRLNSILEPIQPRRVYFTEFVVQ